MAKKQLQRQKKSNRKRLRLLTKLQRMRFQRLKKKRLRLLQLATISRQLSCVLREQSALIMELSIRVKSEKLRFILQTSLKSAVPA